MRFLVFVLLSAMMTHADDRACLEKAITAHDFNSCNDFCYNQFAERKELAMQCYAVCKDKYDQAPDLKMAGKDECHLIAVEPPAEPAVAPAAPNPDEDGFAALVAKLTDAQKKKLKSLRVALDIFVKAQADWIDYTPPGERPGSTPDIRTDTFLDDQFFKFLQDFEAHPEKVVKAKGKLADANRRLNRVYGKCLQSPREEALMAPDDKSVQFFRESQRKWIPYRDAWAVYCRARRPGDKVCSKLVVELTIARASELEHGCGMNPERH